MKNASLAVFLLLAVVLVYWGMTGDIDDDEADFVFSQIAVCALAIASVVVAIRKKENVGLFVLAAAAVAILFNPVFKMDFSDWEWQWTFGGGLVFAAWSWVREGGWQTFLASMRWPFFCRVGRVCLKVIIGIFAVSVVLAVLLFGAVYISMLFEKPVYTQEEQDFIRKREAIHTRLIKAQQKAKQYEERLNEILPGVVMLSPAEREQALQPIEDPRMRNAISAYIKSQSPESLEKRRQEAVWEKFGCMFEDRSDPEVWKKLDSLIDASDFYPDSNPIDRRTAIRVVAQALYGDCDKDEARARLLKYLRMDDFADTSDLVVWGRLKNHVGFLKEEKKKRKFDQANIDHAENQIKASVNTALCYELDKRLMDDFGSQGLLDQMIRHVQASWLGDEMKKKRETRCNLERQRRSALVAMLNGMFEKEQLNFILQSALNVEVKNVLCCRLPKLTAGLLTRYLIEQVLLGKNDAEIKASYKDCSSELREELDADLSLVRRFAARELTGNVN